MKLYTLLLLFLFVSANLYSQKVSFVAVHARTGEPLTLDSVIVINNNINFTRVYKTYENIDLKTMTSIKDNNNSIMSNANNLIFESETFEFDFYNPGMSAINIRLINLRGEIIKELKTFQIEGNYSISIPFSGLPSSVYFVQVLSNLYKLTKQLLYSNSHSSASGNNDRIIINRVAENKILSTDNYTFIGFKRNFHPDTVRLSNPYDGMQIQFILNPLSIWKVRTCSLEILSKAVIYVTHEEKYGSGSSVSERWDSLLKYNCSFSNTRTKFTNCDTVNINDTIKINYCTHDAAWGIDYVFTATIDTASSILRNVYFSYYDNRPLGNEIYTNHSIHLKVPNLKCDSISENYISANVYLKDLQDLKVGYSMEFSDHHIHWVKDITTLVSLQPDPDAYLKIVLTE